MTTNPLLPHAPDDFNGLLADLENRAESGERGHVRRLEVQLLCDVMTIRSEFGRSPAKDEKSSAKENACASTANGRHVSDPGAAVRDRDSAVRSELPSLGRMRRRDS